MSITKAKRDRIRNDILSKFNSDPTSLLSTFIDESLKKHLAPGLKPASAKGKGRKAQKWLQNQVLGLLDRVGEDDPDHVRSQPMGVSGEDLILSPTARKWFPFAPECKNKEKVGFWPTVEQAEANAGKHTPLVVFMKNRTKPWVAVPATTFFAILGSVISCLYWHDTITLKDRLDATEQIQKDQT